jgi:hypothetical protein
MPAITLMEHWIHSGLQSTIRKKPHAALKCSDITLGSCSHVFQSELARTHIANRHAAPSKAPCGAPVLGPISLMNHRRACSVMGCKIAPVRKIAEENSLLGLASFAPIDTNKAPPAAPIPISSSPSDSDSEHSTDMSMSEWSHSESRSEPSSPSASPSPNPPFIDHPNLQFIEDVAIAGPLERDDGSVNNGSSVATVSSDSSLLPRAPPPSVTWTMPECPSLFQVLIASGA